VCFVSCAVSCVEINTNGGGDDHGDENTVYFTAASNRTYCNSQVSVTLR